MDYVYRVTEAAQLPGLSLLIASLCAAPNGPECRLIRPARQQSLADTRASGYKTRDRRGHWDRVCGAVPAGEVSGGAYAGLCKNGGHSVSY